MYKKDDEDTYAHSGSRLFLTIGGGGGASVAQTPCPSLENLNPESFRPADEITKFAFSQKKNPILIHVLVRYIPGGTSWR